MIPKPYVQSKSKREKEEIVGKKNDFDIMRQQIINVNDEQLERLIVT